MKKLILFSVILNILIVVSGCSNSDETGSVIYYEQTQDTTRKEVIVEESTEPITEVESVEESTVAEHRTGNEFIGISDKNLIDDDIYILYEDSVKNDTTYKWRLARTSDNIDITDYALSYYNEYFKSDDEVHAFINFTQNTTTSITCMSGLLFVTTYEYVDKEEHDANLLFSGQMLTSYIIYLDNGDIEKI